MLHFKIFITLAFGLLAYQNSLAQRYVRGICEGPDCPKTIDKYTRQTQDNAKQIIDSLSKISSENEKRAAVQEIENQRQLQQELTAMQNKDKAAQLKVNAAVESLKQDMSLNPFGLQNPTVNNEDGALIRAQDSKPCKNSTHRLSDKDTPFTTEEFVTISGTPQSALQNADQQAREFLRSAEQPAAPIELREMWINAASIIQNQLLPELKCIVKSK